MNTGILTLRKRWPAVAAIAVLLAVALTAGTLFAANEHRRPEPPTVNQQSAADVTNPAPAAKVPAVPPAPERVPAQPDDNDQEEADLPPIVKTPPRYPNLDANLNRLAEVSQAAKQEANSSDGSGGGVTSSGESVPPAEPVLVTFYVEPEQLAAVRQYLEDNGVFVRNVGEDYIEAHVLPSMLGAASEQPGILRVDTVIPPRPAQSQSRAISQGVDLHGASDWHTANYRGQGIKVGVIDSGFEGLSQLQGSELPSNVTARCYFEEARAPSSSVADCEMDGDHGTAVADTLVDVAPLVALYVANPISNGDLRNAVDWMAGQGVEVINYSMGDIVDGPGDGTSPFSNSPLKTIDVAVSNGIIWVTAGGNNAQRVWYGAFSDPDNNGAHNFAPRDEGNTFRLREGERLRAFMRWDDSWGQADCDLDLLLTRRVGNRNVIDFVDDIEQDGSQGSIPRAGIFSINEATASRAGLYALWIVKNECADEPAWIQLTMWDPGPLEHYSPGHHMGNPEESRSTGTMAVGATHYWDTDSIASYSSRGPTIDGRTKPEITGVACGRSSVDAPVTLPNGIQCWFAGTSQAAPHVAGLAAIVKQRFPHYTPAATVRYLQRNAIDRGPSGEDNTWGHGFATLPDPSLQPMLTPTGNIAVRDGANRGEVIVSWDAVPDATYYRIGYVNMETDYPIAKSSVTGEWLEAFVYVDVNAVNLTPANGRVEYTVRRLEPGVRHAVTVLTSDDVVNTRETISATYLWPRNPRWRFHAAR
jgi:subtilisin family serine protease